MLRKNSGRNHLIAIIIVIGICVLALGARAIVRSAAPRERVRVVEVTRLSDIKVEVEQPQAMPDYAPPPPALKKAIKFTPPVVKPDENVRVEEEIKTQEQLNTATITSSIDSTGTGNGLGVEGGVALGEGASNPFLLVEQMPEFPGGEKALHHYLAQNIRYPPEAQAKRITGVIVISFVVGIDGSISDIRIDRGFDKSCENEAVRVFKQMPKWKPGKQRGKPVYVRFTMPLRFSL